MNAAKVNNAGMNSIVTNATNKISNVTGSFVNSGTNAMKNIAGIMPSNMNSMVTNAANSFVNSSTNAMKNIAGPINQSIKNIPSGGPSMSLIIGIAIIIILIAFITMFNRQITGTLHTVIAKIRMWLGFTGMEVQEIVKEAGQDLQNVVPDIEQAITVNKFLPGKKQVFNVSENHYTYSDAEPLCRAFGAELATYEQVKKAWADGADWCNYGWVKGQGAVYPTQQASWDKLQTGTDDERLQCGMPGVNGGYFDNPQLRFGVNCYGDKPGESEHDIKRTLQGTNEPLTPEANAQLKRQLKYRSEMGEIGVLPFKPGSWTE